jgi:hypothetical protein
MPGRPSRRAGITLLGLVALAASPACRRASTDEELIRQVFARAAKAAEERRIGDVVADVSERFRAGDLDRDGARRVAAGVILRGGWLSASVSGSTVRVEGDRAAAVVDVVLARGTGRPSLSALVPGEASVHRFRVRLAHEAEGWKITQASWRPVELSQALAGPPQPDAPADETPR